MVAKNLGYKLTWTGPKLPVQKTGSPSNESTEKGTGTKSKECKMHILEGESAWRHLEFCLKDCTFSWYYLIFHEKGTFVPLRIFT